MIEQEIIDFFEHQGILPEGFVEYMNNGRIKKYPSDADISWFNCFTKTDGDILVSLLVIVPKIVDLKTMLINIHEYAHAIELYSKLGCIYIENVEQSEAFAKKMELEYKKTINK